jgi:predicted nucleic acid-binding protein
MPVKVVDASAIAALLFDEPEAEIVADRLSGDRLAAPGLLLFELANVCLTKARRRPELRAALTKAFRLRHRLAVEIVEVDHDGALAFADAIGLTAYDASYLWLARELGAQLITLDRRLSDAAAILHR